MKKMMHCMTGSIIEVLSLENGALDFEVIKKFVPHEIGILSSRTDGTLKIMCDGEAKMHINKTQLIVKTEKVGRAKKFGIYAVNTMEELYKMGFEELDKDGQIIDRYGVFTEHPLTDEMRIKELEFTVEQQKEVITECKRRLSLSVSAELLDEADEKITMLENNIIDAAILILRLSKTAKF